MNNTYKKITDKFLSIENKYKLLDQKIKGVYFWQISRVNIYLEIKNKILNGNNLIEKNILKKRLKHLPRRLFINSILLNPFFTKKKNEIIIFSSGRLYNDGNKTIDIYTDYLCEDLDKEGISYTKYETNYLNDHILSKRQRNKHIDFIVLFSKLIRFLYSTKLNDKEYSLIESIRKDINENFGIEINILSIIKSDIKSFKSQYHLYKLLFKLEKPKEIFIVNSSDKPYIIAAAKDQKIIINELQHGLISDCDIINNFPYIKPNSLEYFPTRFFMWNNIDMCYASLPLSKDNIIPFRNKHIDKWLQKTTNINKEKNTILVISQPFESLNILEYIENNISQLKEYKFIYKIHPAENKDIIKQMIEKMIIKYTNIYIIEDEEPIYSLLKKAEYVLGVYSSALFEAPLFKCKIILLNLEGVEMSLPLINNNKAKLLDLNRSLPSALYNTLQFPTTGNGYLV